MARQGARRILVGCKGLLATPGAAHKPFRPANRHVPPSEFGIGGFTCAGAL